MEIETEAANLLEKSMGTSTGGMVFVCIISILAAALHVAGMNALYEYYQGAPDCCNNNNDENNKIMYKYTRIGIVLALAASVANIAVVVVSRSTDCYKPNRAYFQAVKLLFDNAYGAIAITVLLLKLFDGGQGSIEGAVEILLGSVSGLILQIYWAKNLVKRESDGCYRQSHRCYFLSILLAIGQIVVCICYLTVPAQYNAYCFYGPYTISDDGPYYWELCKSNPCLTVGGNVTNAYENSYGTITEYCSIDCCYWTY